MTEAVAKTQTTVNLLFTARDEAKLIGDLLAKQVAMTPEELDRARMLCDNLSDILDLVNTTWSREGMLNPDNPRVTRRPMYRSYSSLNG